MFYYLLPKHLRCYPISLFMFSAKLLARIALLAVSLSLPHCLYLGFCSLCATETTLVKVINDLVAKSNGLFSVPILLMHQQLSTPWTSSCNSLFFGLLGPFTLLVFLCLSGCSSSSSVRFYSPLWDLWIWESPMALLWATSLPYTLPPPTHTQEVHPGLSFRLCVYADESSLFFPHNSIA